MMAATDEGLLGRHAVYPGTFDPVTPGHLDVIRAGLLQLLGACEVALALLVAAPALDECRMEDRFARRIRVTHCRAPSRTGV